MPSKSVPVVALTTSEIIAHAVKEVRREFGEESATTLDDEGLHSNIKGWVKTQSLLLDRIISGGKGIPCGRITTITGKVSSGKTTIATHILAEVQAQGGVAVLLDTEYAFDRARAQRIGISESDLILCQPSCVEDALATIEKMVEVIRDVAPDTPLVIVWDSVAGTPSRSELDDAFGKATFGIVARLMSQGLRKIVKLIAEQHVVLILINQLRDDIGSMWGGSTMIAENAIRYHSSIVIDCSRKEILRTNEVAEPHGIKASVYVNKNKIHPPFKTAEIVIRFDQGMDTTASLLEVANALGLVNKKGGGFFEYKGVSFRSSEIHEKLTGDLFEQLKADTLTEIG